MHVGDKTGVFSTSIPISVSAPVRYGRGKTYLKANGFQAVGGSLCGKRDFYRSGTIQEQAEEFNELLRWEAVLCRTATPCLSAGWINSSTGTPGTGLRRRGKTSGAASIPARRRADEIMMEVIGSTSIPNLAEFDCCHTHPMLTMPIGCQVELDAGNKPVRLLEGPVL